MSYLRPDEISTESFIKKEREKNQIPKRLAKTAVGIGGAALGASAIGGISSKVLPFLSKLVPINLAIKGINKVSPKLGAFLKQGMESGLNVKDGLQYIRDNMANNDEEAGFTEKPKKQSLTEGLQEDFNKKYGQQQPVEPRNALQKHSPELFEYLKNEINAGRPVMEAGALAQSQSKFQPIIKKLEKDYKANFSSILQAVFGEGLYPSGNQQQAGQSQQQQMGKGQQALMQSMQQLTQLLGKGK